MGRRVRLGGWFHNHVENLTFDIGADNRNPTALQSCSNNSGAILDGRSRAESGNGSRGWSASMLVVLTEAGGDIDDVSGRFRQHL